MYCLIRPSLLFYFIISSCAVLTIIHLLLKVSSHLLGYFCTLPSTKQQLESELKESFSSFTFLLEMNCINSFSLYHATVISILFHV